MSSLPYLLYVNKKDIRIIEVQPGKNVIRPTMVVKVRSRIFARHPFPGSGFNFFSL